MVAQHQRVTTWLTSVASNKRLTAAATKSAYHKDIKSFFLWAHRRELVAVNPMLKNVPPRPPKHLWKPRAL